MADSDFTRRCLITRVRVLGVTISDGCARCCCRCFSSARVSMMNCRVRFHCSCRASMLGSLPSADSEMTGMLDGVVMAWMSPCAGARDAFIRII